MEKEKLIFETGLKEYEVNGGRAVFSFAPTDSSLMSRYQKLYEKAMELTEELKAAHEKVTAEHKAIDDPASIAFTEKMLEADKEIKEELRACFGAQNDFDAIFDYINAITITVTGDMVVTNFLAGIEPIIKAEFKKSVDAAASLKANSMKKGKRK